MGSLTQSTVEFAALTGLESMGWRVVPGLEIASGQLFAERRNYVEVVLANCSEHGVREHNR